MSHLVTFLQIIGGGLLGGLLMLAIGALLGHLLR